MFTISAKSSLRNVFCLLNTIVNQLRYPNIHTYFFSNVFLIFAVCSVELGQSKKLYGALIRAKAADNWCSLDEAQRRIIEKNLLSMQHSGVGLPAEQQEKFNALQQELASLSSSFRNNVMDSTKLFKYVITDPKDMEGVPHGARTLLSQRAVSAGHANSTAESGPWIVTLDHPSCK